jgi:DNA-binding GntR family transcriptional regulator
MEDLADLTIAREVIDGEAFRLSIERGDTAWEAEIVGAFHRLARATGARSSGFVADIELWEVAHKAFHRALISACGSSTLLEIAGRLYDRGARYRMLMATISLPSERLVKEHQRLVDAVLERDPDQGCELLRRHMRITGEIIAAGAKSRGTVNASPMPAVRSGPTTIAAAGKREKRYGNDTS